jgi:hypothetical protein
MFQIIMVHNQITVGFVNPALVTPDSAYGAVR